MYTYIWECAWKCYRIGMWRCTQKSIWKSIWTCAWKHCWKCTRKILRHVPGHVPGHVAGDVHGDAPVHVPVCTCTWAHIKACTWERTWTCTWGSTWTNIWKWTWEFLGLCLGLLGLWNVWDFQGCLKGFPRPFKEVLRKRSQLHLGERVLLQPVYEEHECSRMRTQDNRTPMTAHFWVW